MRCRRWSGYDSQLIIISTAPQSDDRIDLPLPDHIKGGTTMKVVPAGSTKVCSRKPKHEQGWPDGAIFTEIDTATSCHRAPCAAPSGALKKKFYLEVTY